MTALEGVTALEGAVLAAIAHNDRVTVAEVAGYHIRRPDSSVRQAIARLERRGLVKVATLTGSPPARAYSITRRGEAELDAWAEPDEG